MAIINVVKFDGSKDLLAWKYPSDNLKLGTQLIVKTSQYAFFVEDGLIYDEFPEGRYTLETRNLPLLNRILSLPFGGQSPFQAEVWFVDMLSKPDIKWGTPRPILMKDPVYKVIVPLRAHGQFGISVTDPRNFLLKMVGNKEVFSKQELVDYFQGSLITSLTSAVSKKMIEENISILRINEFSRVLSSYCKEIMSEEFSKCGLQLESFYILSINIPESILNTINAKKSGQ